MSRTKRNLAVAAIALVGGIFGAQALACPAFNEVREARSGVKAVQRTVAAETRGISVRTLTAEIRP